MISRTDIANAALSRIGQKAVSDIDYGPDLTAGAVRLVFEQTVRTMGRQHPFKCLLRRQALVQNTVAPAFGWSYAYDLPPELLRLKTLNDLDAWNLENFYTIEDNTLLCDVDSAKIVYTAYTADSTKYDPLFVEALIVLLAAKLATRIRQDEQLGLALMQEYRQIALPDAVVVDANEHFQRPPHPGDYSRWVAARGYTDRPVYTTGA